MIQVIISPAKQMTVDNDAFAPRGIPPFPERTERVVRALNDIERTQGTAGLKALWGVSDKLLAENVERLHGFSHVSGAEQLAQPQASRLLSPAIFSYVGIQYRSMAPEVLDERALDWLQDHLWVLSALYGCARPLDAVQPYRLEMGAKLAVDGARTSTRFGTTPWHASSAGRTAHGEARRPSSTWRAPSTPRRSCRILMSRHRL